MFAGGYLKTVLEHKGVVVWCSSADMVVAADWEKQIQHALAQSDWYIVVLSPDAADSDWVRAEAHWALEKRKGRVIPLMIRSCDPAMVHIKLGTIQFVDFRGDLVEAVAKLLAVMDQQVDKSYYPADDPTMVSLPSRVQVRSMTAVLTFKSDAGYKEELLVDIEQPRVMGRAWDADIRLDGKSVSRHHARLSITDDDGTAQLQIEDLASLNGVCVNGERIQSPHLLKVGDTIDLGAIRLRFEKLY